MKKNKPKLFIGSSVEGLEVAYAIQSELEHDSEPTVWSQGVFNLTQSTLSDLLSALDSFDAAIFVMSPDDVVKMRGQEQTVTRDNVLFELGMFIGRLGPEKTFMVKPRNSQDFHVPTDLLGLTPGVYDNERSDGNLQAALGPFCFQVRKQLAQMTVKSEIIEVHESDIDLKYNELINKLIQLGGYQRMLENQEWPSDSMLKSYHELRADVFSILKSDFGNLLEMITASGILSVFFGDIYDNAYVILDIKSVDFLDNAFIQFGATDITTSSMDIPKEIVTWFDDRFDIVAKEKI
ncbi:TIR domain-containing protein [Vibrio vulnificus]|uniref:TIR domain-containing protein n=1 Tax=Vibrio vulnificus TaxID=672 RepID=UPI00188C0A41|nr:nucleotide-binding protein [Vibrio vulnificus]MBF4453336.1 nucleotide-binding protein [Vibrio vulnificus]MBF4499024.1 nucleotide-binding protein [Vibrio vulnificus]MBL6179174.1 nucleotide-binding protein [Vibrio vulnificus]HDY7983757.1 nucleotide-binding protein [Vibrio vulnificus]HDY8007216.1 nucleotide-binding protein [Vibrio vulnificus]